MGARRQEHTAQVAEHRAGAQREMDELVNANAAEQARERTAAHSEVQELGSEWDEAQRGLVDSSRTEADTVAREGAQDLTQERTQAEERAAQHVQDGNREAAAAREQAEQQAARERQSAEKESGGILSWVAKQATDFFNAVKNRIQQAFEAARALVRDAIQRAQRLAADAIEAARRNIVGIIRRVGDALISIGDRLLAGFPGLRDRFRAAIRERVARAEAAVNRLAGALKEGVQRALNFLGSALNAALGLLERGMLAAVDAANRAVQGAIQFGRSVVQGFAAFAALIRDVAANPGQWIRNLGAAVVDGIRNHLWAALKTAIKEWFNSKIDEVLGLGMMVWRLLSQGGIAIAQVGRMVWEGLKQAIPMALIQILIQRLVAMIMPAVGAVMAIIETLQAAWGTVSRIIQAFERFFAFLRAVRTGNAGPQFAQALAAASVAVIDFVSNFLLTRLRRPAGALAGRIRAIAQRIGQRLRGLGQRLRRGSARVSRFLRRGRRRGQSAAEQRRAAQERRRRKQEQLDRAVKAIEPEAEALLRQGASRLWFSAKLLWWRVRYRLSSLKIDRAGHIYARVNPGVRLKRPKGKEVSDEELGRLLLPLFAAAEQEYERRLRADPERGRRIQAAQEAWARGDRNSLAGLSRFEQQVVLRTPATTPGTQVVAEPGVDIWRAGRSPRQFMVRRGGRYAPKITATGRQLRAMLDLMTEDAKTFGVSMQTIAQILASRADTVGVKIASLAGSIPTGGSKSKQQQRDRFIGRLRAVSFLALAGEPSRQEGIGTAAIVSSTMAAQGQVSLQETQTAAGSQAPMAPIDAANAPTFHPRVGRIFSELLEQTKASGARPAIIVAEGGYTLNRLAERIRRWLEQVYRRHPNPEQLRAAQARLHAELVSLLARFDG